MLDLDPKGSNFSIAAGRGPWTKETKKITPDTESVELISISNKFNPFQACLAGKGRIVAKPLIHISPPVSPDAIKSPTASPSDIKEFV
jgi:hypothetical protein